MEKVVPENAVLIPDHAKRVFQGVVFDVYQWPQKLFDGTNATFEMIRRPDTVESICIVGDKILVLEDTQPHRGTLLSFPGGRTDDNELAIDAIGREVHEETGYSFKKWRLLTVSQPQRKIEWFIYTYLAWEPTGKEAPHVDPGEQISVEFKSLTEVKQLVDRKAGHLGEVQSIFGQASNINELLQIPEYQGRSVTIKK